MPDAGAIIGRYVIEGPLGRGGMATVHLARQPDLDRLVALKELAAFHALDPALAERFSREARVVASLTNPYIVTVYEFFEHDGVPYIAMEYVEGGSLRSRMHSLWLSQAVGALEGILAGLAHAHAHGVVHRDLKPENVLVTPQGRVKLTDFGIAKAFNQVWTANYPTATGMAIGTPVYMAPEQAMGRDIGPWTDLYAVGVVAYEMLAGRPPFVAEEEPLAVLMKHLTTEPEPLSRVRPEVDERLSDWVGRLLAKEPRERFPGAAEAWEELEEIVVALAGPLWRRQARIDAADPSVEQRPLTPASFEATPKEGVRTPPSLDPPTPPPPPLPSPSPSPAAPAPRRRGLLIGGALAALAAVIVLAVVLLGGGGSDNASPGATPVTAQLPDCLQSMTKGLPKTQVLDGVPGDLGPASALDGKRIAVVIKLPTSVAAITYEFHASPSHLFVAGPLRDERCRTVKPGFYGSGKYPNLQDYDQVRFDQGGKHWGVGINADGGKVGAGLAEIPDAGLKVTQAARSGRHIDIAGTIDPGVDSEVGVRVTLTPSQGPPVVLQRVLPAKDGRWSGRLAVPADAVDAPAGPLEVGFEGTDQFADDRATAQLT